MSSPAQASPLSPPLPDAPGQRLIWGQLRGSAPGLAIARAARHAPLLVLCDEVATAARLEEEARFYLAESASATDDAAAPRDGVETFAFADWETLPYDRFSPHPDIVSRRLETLYRLPGLRRGAVIAAARTAMFRLPPRRWLERRALLLSVGDRLDREAMRRRLEQSGYRAVGQVMECGEFAVRGSLIDLFPMGAVAPYRIDLFDDRVETIRRFDPDNQRSAQRVAEVRLLPAREFPLDEGGIERFRAAWRAAFPGDSQRCPVYRQVSAGQAPPGVEYSLPLFFEQTDTLFDYLPEQTTIVTVGDLSACVEGWWRDAAERCAQRSDDAEHPALPPGRLLLAPDEFFAALKGRPRVRLERTAQEAERAGCINFAVRAAPALTIAPHVEEPLKPLLEFLRGFDGRALIAAESPGRREALLELLRNRGLRPVACAGWGAFLRDQAPLMVAAAPLEEGLLLERPAIALLSESQLYGGRIMQRRRRRRRGGDVDAVVRDLAELTPNSPVIHADHGVGRYRGLQTLDVGGMRAEYLMLEYDRGDKLYVPVAALHLVSRYAGAEPDKAPLHRLGANQWARAQSRARQKAHDVAAELLDIHARRAARDGWSCPAPDDQYRAFAAQFPFEETPDQRDAIDAVVEDLTQPRPMDRLVCGDVGFGKTEVAMRAAFLAAMGGRQVAILVPTTLLAQQHYENFVDRFVDWPVRIELLSRFRSDAEQKETLRALREGQADIVIGTHKLLRPEAHFKALGLVIVDEEHRFGVRQKERFKALRAEVHLLTLTATPIPRTLNFSLAGLRDLSIIATPPANRVAIKTFVREWDAALIREACLREIQRGGQVYFLHNRVETIERSARELTRLLPEASVEIAHGQMRERELEAVMRDFYHRRFNILVCTTIIESGIDVPTANTLIVDRADRLGLAQLYQIRGRVGRSHHRAYAWLIVPPRASMTADAIKRLTAIEALEELGAGFRLAIQDMEIRGAGELLGAGQSGHMQEIGFSLYSDMLHEAVAALKSGDAPPPPPTPMAEVELGAPALLPESYLPDVNARLVFYRRVAAAADDEALTELRVEAIDRFGKLPEEAETLFAAARLKRRVEPLGVRKIEADAESIRIRFIEKPPFDATRLIALLQQQPRRYRLDGAERLRIVGAFDGVRERVEAVEGLAGALG